MMKNTTKQPFRGGKGEETTRKTDGICGIRAYCTEIHRKILNISARNKFHTA